MGARNRRSLSDSLLFTSASGFVHLAAATVWHAATAARERLDAAYRVKGGLFIDVD